MISLLCFARYKLRRVSGAELLGITVVEQSNLLTDRAGTHSLASKGHGSCGQASGQKLGGVFNFKSRPRAQVGHPGPGVALIRSGAGCRELAGAGRSWSPSTQQAKNDIRQWLSPMVLSLGESSVSFQGEPQEQPPAWGSPKKTRP